MVTALEACLLPGGVAVSFTLDIARTYVAKSLSCKDIAGELSLGKLVLFVPVNYILNRDTSASSEETNEHLPL